MAPARSRAAGRASGSAARRGSRSAPSAPPGRRPRSRAASRTGRRRSCRSPPRPSAGAASAPRRARSASISSNARELVAGRLEGQGLEPARRLLPRPAAARVPGGPPGAGSAEPPATPGRGGAPRRRAGDGPPGRVRVGREVSGRQRLPGAGSPSRCASRPAAARPPARAARSACQAHSRMRCGRILSEAGWTGTRPVVWSPRWRLAPRRAEQLVLGHGEAPLLELAAQQEPRAGLELVGEPGAVEPHRRQLPALIGDLRLEDGQPRAGESGGRARPAHLDLDGRLLPQLQVTEADRGGAIAVAVREWRRRSPRSSIPISAAASDSFGPAPCSFVSGASRTGRLGPADRRGEQLLAAARRDRSQRAAGWLASSA